MNTTGNTSMSKESLNLSAEDIAAYLKRNPEFFNDHPELLEDISVPHSIGGAVSLVEKQVAVLREQNEQTRQRMHELIEIARDNEELAKRMHNLALGLMDAIDPKEIFTLLYKDLAKNFRADGVTVKLFAGPAFIDTYAGPEFVSRESKEQKAFNKIIEKRKPISGQLKSKQRKFLFGDEGDKISSAVIVPLHGADWGGVLVIGANDPDRFHKSIGVELLANLGEILSFIIKPWVAEK
jgi:uncharacterized protein YigA (DUF484 family)